MINLIGELRSRGIDNSFRSIGLDFESLFPHVNDPVMSTMYGAREWIVKDVPVYGVVINAVPPEDSLEDQPWEEWYSFESRTHHHVLYLIKSARYDVVFKAPQHDDIHPERTPGRHWWVVDDPDPSTLLTRRP